MFASFISKFNQRNIAKLVSKMQTLKEVDKAMLDMLDQHKFQSPKKAGSKKRKDHPIEIKYEENTIKSSLKPQPTSQKGMRQHFKYIYDKISEMRKDRTAPVDSIGAMTLPDPNAPQEEKNFQLLVSLMLSVQTKDEATAKAFNNLKKFGLTIEKMAKASEEDICTAIHNANFNKTKAKNIKKIAIHLIEDTKKQLPDNLKGLLDLPGVGPKIGVLYLNFTLGEKIGIGVDTHVHRISNRLGLVKTKQPEETRKELESFIAKEYWDINELLVGFGQQTCQPIKPKCGDCLLNDLCPEGKANTRYLKVQTKKTKVKAEDEEGNEKKIEVKEESIEVIKLPKRRASQTSKASQKESEEKEDVNDNKDEDKEDVKEKAKKVKILVKQKSLK